MKEMNVIRPPGLENEFGETIMFSPTVKQIFQEKNLFSVKLTGEMRKFHKLNKANIISSFIDSLEAQKVSFNNVDIKDCRISNSYFKECNFNHASQNNNWIKDSHYSNCTFSQTSITLSDFTNCSFVNCDFTNLIISDCRFIKCVFSHCITSNKIIESSLILDCTFENMEIEIFTISDNFGLSNHNLIDCTLRIANYFEDEAKKINQPVDVVTKLFANEENKIQKFKYCYFISPLITSDISEEVDGLFDITAWLKLCRNPNRFKLAIEKLHEFLLYLFDSDKLRLRTLFQLFEVSAQLSDFLARNKDLIDLQRTVDGVFITVERILEEYIKAAEILLGKFEEDNVCSLLVEGPLDISYYTLEFADLLKISPVKFVKIMKHNSPNELLIQWDNIKNFWPFILFFFSTKFKFELNRLKEIAILIEGESQQIVKNRQLLKIESGFLEKTDTFSFKLRTLLPGHNELNLILQISPERYKKIIRIMKDIIVFNKNK